MERCLRDLNRLIPLSDLTLVKLTHDVSNINGLIISSCLYRLIYVSLNAIDLTAFMSDDDLFGPQMLLMVMRGRLLRQVEVRLGMELAALRLFLDVGDPLGALPT